VFGSSDCHSSRLLVKVIDAIVKKGKGDYTRIKQAAYT
jgi:hypothetical protein